MTTYSIALELRTITKYLTLLQDELRWLVASQDLDWSKLFWNDRLTWQHKSQIQYSHVRLSSRDFHPSSPQQYPQVSLSLRRQPIQCLMMSQCWHDRSCLVSHPRSKRTPTDCRSQYLGVIKLDSWFNSGLMSDNFLSLIIFNVNKPLWRIFLFHS